MKSAARAKYEELWQSLYQRASKSGEEVSEEDDIRTGEQCSRNMFVTRTALRYGASRARVDGNDWFARRGISVFRSGQRAAVLL